MFQKLPLLDFLEDGFENTDLSEFVLISCQHILQSNYIVFEYLFKRGLNPNNTFLLGKAYSSSKKVYEHLSAQGVNVHNHSFSFDSHVSYDSQFEKYINEFLSEALQQVKKLDGDTKIIIVDDGGYIIEQINSADCLNDKEVVAIEWTTSGYKKLLGLELNIPVLNMARSNSKLEIESPVIAMGVVEKIKKKYGHVFSSTKKAVVIGAGAIGSAVKAELHRFGKTSINIDLDTPLRNLEKDYDLVVGCTGENVLNAKDLDSGEDVVLVSASSSDREFTAVDIRKIFTQNTDVHKDYVYQNVTLANSGFPINFDGNEQFLPLEKIQITEALAFASVCIVATYKLEKGLNVFPKGLDKEITDSFLKLSS